MEKIKNIKRSTSHASLHKMSFGSSVRLSAKKETAPLKQDEQPRPNKAKRSETFSNIQLLSTRQKAVIGGPQRTKKVSTDLPDSPKGTKLDSEKNLTRKLD